MDYCNQDILPQDNKKKRHHLKLSKYVKYFISSLVFASFTLLYVDCFCILANPHTVSDKILHSVFYKKPRLLIKQA